jgi:hypothetical protein
MSIWDAIGNGLEFGNTEDNKGKPLLATTFTANFGDTINTLMGGGRFTNLIGSDAKVVFDWEEAFKDGLSKLPYVGKPVGKVLEGKVMSAFMGLGGDAGMVYGNKTAFHYSGIPFTSRRGKKPSVAFSDTQTGSDKIAYSETKAERLGVYALVGVGIAAIVALSVTVRLKYSNFPMNNKKTELETPDNELAKNLICGFFVICEDRWLLLLRHLDIGFQMAFLFKNTLIASKAALVRAEQDLKVAQAVVKSFPNSARRNARVEMLNSIMIERQAQLNADFTSNTNNLKCYLEW